MNKFLIVLFNLFLFISCSNINVQKIFSEEQKKDLYALNYKIKDNLQKNNFEYLENNIEKSIINKKILTEIEKIDFSDMNIFLSKVVFENKFPTSILGLNMEDNTFYFELKYKYDYNSQKWKIYEIEERR